MRSITGEGELWVNNQGLPVRLILNTHTPHINDRFDSQATTVIDYRYDEAQVEAALALIAGLPKPAVSISSLLLETPKQTAVSSFQAFLENTTLEAMITNSLLTVLAFILIATISLMLIRNHKVIRVTIPVTVALLMVLNPFLSPFVMAHEQSLKIKPVTLNEALGLAENRDTTNLEPQNQRYMPATAPEAITLQTTSNSTTQCGAGSQVDDLDSDGLDDFTEICLGTSRYSIDTDADLITDTLEVNGFIYDSQTWYSNPLALDSNQDGLDDFSEWPSPVGLAPSHDPDGDGVPNLWDNDNDGDGVLDKDDIDPYTVTDYEASFSLESTVDEDDFAGYQYIRFQVQPQNEDHLRYTTTALDWPYDRDGNIQDHDFTDENDFTLTPAIKIETLTPPSEELIEQYGASAFNLDGISRWHDAEPGDRFEMYIILTPMSDGGRISAFEGQIAYGPEDLDDITWDSMEMVWLVNMDVHLESGDEVVTENIGLVEYTEAAFRVTGMEITKSGEADFAIFATPNTPHDNRDLHQLMLGMDSSFFSALDIDLATLVTRFDTDSTLITETWGLPATDVAVVTPDQPAAHLDAIGVDAADAIYEMLDTYYPTTEDEMVSVAVAAEIELGITTLDESYSSGDTFSFNLANIPDMQLRTLSMKHFEYQASNSNPWQPLENEDVIEELTNRHGDQSANLLELEDTYPDITEFDIYMAVVAYTMAWTISRSQVISIDGQTQIPQTVSDQQIADRLTLSDTDPAIYLITAENLLPAFGAGNWTNNDDWNAGILYSKIAVDVAFTLDLMRDFARTADTLYDFTAGGFKFIVQKTITAVTGRAFSTANAVGTVDDFGQLAFAKPAGTAVSKVGRAISIAADVVGFILLVVTITLIWLDWANFYSPYDYDKNYATAYAITATVIAVFMFILSLTVFGAVLVAAFALAALILYYASDGEFDANAEMTHAITSAFYDVEAYTILQAIDFEGMDADFAGGLTSGSSLTLSDQFFGVIKRQSGNDYSELDRSSIDAFFEVSETSGVTTSSKQGESFCEIGRFVDKSLTDYDYYVYYDHTKMCENSLSASFVFDEAGINIPISLLYKITAVTRYDEYIITQGHETKTDNLHLPDELESKDRWDPTTLYFDILPATLEELWNWDQLTNYDLDGDGILQNTSYQPPYNRLYTEETQLGTDPTLWDSDGDGLSDQFEVSSADELGTNPTVADTDGDGLNDGEEYQRGTLINDTDTDDDGLDDGQEVLQYNGSTWSGGGWMVDINGTDYWVFTNPINGDLDRDDLRDGSEISNGTSPTAVNDGPTLTLTGNSEISPSGSQAIFVKSGDVVSATVDLLNVGASAIEDTLSICVPSSLTNISFTESGDRIPTMVQDGDCYNWDFSTNNLLLFQEFHVQMSATAGTSTSVDEISVSLPYQVADLPKPIIETLAYVEDNTAPTVQITSPNESTQLAGSFYVMGGFSQDEHTWVDRVEVTVPVGDGTTTETHVVTDIAPWAYTWDLPDDGIVTPYAVAYDGVGNASVLDDVTVTVDSLGPVITINIAEGETISADTTEDTVFDLNGTVTDNYSGLRLIQLRVNDRRWETLWSDDTLSLSENWSGEWRVRDVASAQGEHKLRLRAYDDFGNITYLERTVLVDVLAPTSELTNRTFLSSPPHVAANEDIDLFGVANDAGNNPMTADPVTLQDDLHSINDATVWLQPDRLTDDDNGVTMTWIGDFTGDRFGDLAVGFPAAGNGVGKIVIVPGKAGDWPIPNADELLMLVDSKPSYTGYTGSGLGSYIQPAGDFNGDGLDDMLIGDLVNDRIFLVHGDPIGNALNRKLQPGEGGSQWAEIIAQLDGDDSITAHFSSAGDVNNDNLSDILISTVNATEGNVYLLLGDVNFVGEKFADFTAGAIFPTSAAGASVGAVADVNGDFVDDFAIASGGTVYLFDGNGGWVEGGQTILSPSDAIGTFATSDSHPTIVGNGDMNGDGIGDFVFSNGSTPTVVFGDSGNNFSQQELSGFPSALSGFVAGVGDVNKDTLSDLLIGNADGDAYLIHGDNLSTIAATIEGVESASSAPYVAGADLVGDGSSDLAIVPSDAVSAGYGLDSFNQAQVPFINSDWLSLSSSNGPRNGKATNSSVLESVLAGSAILPGDVTVGPGDDVDYNSIQDAIDAPGSARVLIEPGIYAEAITLANDVEVIGSGADRTYITFSSGVTETVLVNADGAVNASLLNVSLVGESGKTGVSVSDSSSNIFLGRTIIRDMDTAVSIDGLNADLEMKNNSFIGNVDGVNATNCGSVDIRNTIFAYNLGTALQYDDGCALIQRHQFNLYWANGTDMLPNDPGGGEIFADPLFIDFGSNDFRTESFSPVIDAGGPGDPVAPGAGDAPDIGHIEQTGTSFFADDDYCSTCENDGLIWGVDAFATIQEAADVAIDTRTNIKSDTPVMFSVGVGAGIYTESVVISGSLQLLGSDADVTTIQGDTGPAVTANGVIYATISGFTLIGGGASPIGVQVDGGSSSLEINRNIIRDNDTGIYVTDRASGSATYNTIVNNGTAVETDGQYSWLDLESNIISGNTNGLVAGGPSASESYGTGVMYSNYNIMNNTLNYSGVISGVFDLIDVDPSLDTNYYLLIGSPAIDQARPEDKVLSGGGLRADIGWHELRGAPLTIIMGQADDSVGTENIGVTQVEYAVVSVADPTSPVTSTLPTVWSTATLTSPDEKATYWNATYTSSTEGYYRIYSRATDVLGNAEIDAEAWYEGAFIVDDTIPVVTISSRRYGGTQASSWVLLQGEVTDYSAGNSFDIDEIYFEADGQRYDALWDIESWEADGISPRSFHFLYRNTLPTGDINFQAFALDGAGHVGSSSVISESLEFVNPPHIDILKPVILTLAYEHDQPEIPPLRDDLVAGTVTFSGEGYDESDGFGGASGQSLRSGTMAFDLSFDGGQTWNAANTFLENLYTEFTYTWEVPLNIDATSIPVHVRSTDYVDNSTTEIIVVTFDTAPPKNYTPITFSAPTGSHLDVGEAEATLTIDWNQPTDNSGTAVSLVGGSFSDDQPVPTIQTTETITTVLVDIEPGYENHGFYFAVGAIDHADNQAYATNYGPWYGSNMRSAAEWDETTQSHIEDGVVETDNFEWLIPTEYLDIDVRPNTDQLLYATWDGSEAWIGWQGASWDTDGELWLYYDLLTGGSTQPADGSSVTLPFEADFAVHVPDGDQYGQNAIVWRYDDDAWESKNFQSGDELWTSVSHDALSSGTEVSLGFSRDFVNLPAPTDGYDHHRMIAYAVTDAGDVWSAFPVSNRLDGNFATYFEWTITNDGFDLLELPTGSRLPAATFAASSNPPSQETVSTDDLVEYVVEINNIKDVTTTGIQLDLATTAGLSFVSVDGATCNDCAASDAWLLDVASIPLDSSQLVTITAQLDSNLTGVTAVTNTIKLFNGSIELPSIELISHIIDIDPPVVTVETLPDNVLSLNNATINGLADDFPGTGVERVEVSVASGPWQPATGTIAWTTDISTLGASGSLQVDIRATDYHGNMSTPLTVIYNVDGDAPIISPTVPALVGGSGSASLTGTTEDPAPASALVESVEVQFDDAISAWESANLGSGDPQSYLYNWLLPPEEGITHTVRFRATDYAGNVTTSIWSIPSPN